MCFYVHEKGYQLVPLFVSVSVSTKMNKVDLIQLQWMTLRIHIRMTYWHNDQRTK